jgi:hypothetical protein
VDIYRTALPPNVTLCLIILPLQVNTTRIFLGYYTLYDH